MLGKNSAELLLALKSANVLGHFIAVENWHMAITQNNIEIVLLKPSEHVRTIIGHLNGIAKSLQLQHDHTLIVLSEAIEKRRG